MGFYRGPNIVTNGLVLALDAANPKSYISGSSIVRDVSGNLHTSSLVNGTSFVNNTFIFDGTDDYINAGNLLNVTNNFTFVINMKGSTTGIQPIISRWDAIGLADRQYLLRTSASILQFWDSNSTSYLGGNQLDYDNWKNICISINGANSKMFVNGSQVGSTFSPTITQDNTINTLIGAYYGTFPSIGQLLTGSIANFYSYNRALTAQEVEQNYDALKGRFGMD